jgi:hypothetical protein
MSGGRRRLRIGLLGFYHEANSFAPVQVDDAYIRAAGTFWGDDLLREYRGSESTAGGFIAAAEEDGLVDLVPLVLSVLVPAGPVTAEALTAQAENFRAALTAEGPFDGVLVVLHGAAVSEQIDDVDGHLLGVVREAVGPGVLIGTSLDLHANISAEMCEAADLLNTYRTNPHVDAAPMGEEIARLLFAAARGSVTPTTAFVSIPAFINILRQNTDVPPMSDIMAEVRATAALPGVLTATVAEGYPYADVPEMGMSVVVITDDAPERAAELAGELAQSVWQRREDFDARIPGPDEAILIASEAAELPVLLLDVGDNIGGGAPGDSVVLLEAAIRAGFRDLVTIRLGGRLPSGRSRRRTRTDDRTARHVCPHRCGDRPGDGHRAERRRLRGLGNAARRVPSVRLGPERGRPSLDRADRGAHHAGHPAADAGPARGARTVVDRLPRRRGQGRPFAAGRVWAARGPRAPGRHTGRDRGGLLALLLREAAPPALPARTRCTPLIPASRGADPIRRAFP